VAKVEPFEPVLPTYDISGMNRLVGPTRALTDGKGGVPSCSASPGARWLNGRWKPGPPDFRPRTPAARSLVNAVRFRAVGWHDAPIQFNTAAPDRAAVNPLTAKVSLCKLQARQGLCEGKANKLIARDPGIQRPTMLRMKTLYRNITADNRTQAAMIARDAGMFLWLGP